MFETHSVSDGGSHGGSMQPHGDLKLHVVRGNLDPNRERIAWPSCEERGTITQHGLPHRDLTAEVNEWRARNVKNLWRGFWRITAAKKLKVPTMYGALFLTKIDGATGDVIPFGLASMRVVTTTGVGFIVDAHQNIVELENMKFHGYGTGSTAEATADTALVTELTTQYNPDNTRPTGTTVEGASGNIYRTVATFTPDSGGTIALREHGVFSQAATGGGVLLDRTLFAAVNLDSTVGDSLQTTYELTYVAGG